MTGDLPEHWDDSLADAVALVEAQLRDDTLGIAVLLRQGNPFSQARRAEQVPGRGAQRAGRQPRALPGLGGAGGEPPVTEFGIFSVEHLRCQLAGLDTLSLAADGDDERQAAMVALGLHPRAEHDAEPACDWCGRSDPPGGLTDESLGGPVAHACADLEDCHAERAKREPLWLDKQFKAWRIDWDKYRRALAYQQELAARSRYGSGIYALAAEQADPLDLLALAEVRAAAEPRAMELAGQWLAARPQPQPRRYYRDELAEQELQLALAAPREEEQAPPPPPEPVRFDPWGHTMRHPRQRMHTLGHHLSYKGVTDGASAVAHRNVRARG